MNINVTSSDIMNGQPIPKISLCPKYGGGDVSPSLKWSSVSDAKCYALYCYDPDVPNGQTWIHWIISYIPSNVTELPQMTGLNTKYLFTSNGNLLIQCKNSNNKYNYGGPCPGESMPQKLHRYYFTIYALNKIVDLINSDCSKFLDDIQDHIIAKGQIMGTFMKN